MNNETLNNFFKNRKLNYHFDDDVKYGKRQSTVNSHPNNKMKVGGLDLTSELIKELATCLPLRINLSSHLLNIHDQLEEDIATSCAISAALEIRTNYINWERYKFTKLFFGNRVSPISPSVLYIQWNANVQSDAKEGPSIASCLKSLESHKAVDTSKYNDNIEKINKEPDLMAFYHASKLNTIEFFKINQHEDTLKVLLSKGFPIICGIVIYPAFKDLVSYQFGLLRSPDYLKETSVGAHVIVLVGYNEDKNNFIFANSLGKRWGTDGYGVIDYTYILDNKIAGDFYTINYKGW